MYLGNLVPMYHLLRHDASRKKAQKGSRSEQIRLSELLCLNFEYGHFYLSVCFLRLFAAVSFLNFRSLEHHAILHNDRDVLQ
jgi:hypothetical protein